MLDGLNGQSRPDQVLPLEPRLRALADNLPVTSIEELWVFPPLPDRDLACEFIVLVCYDGGAERRRIVTCHMDAQFSDPEGDDLEWVQRVREQGTAPQRWVSDIPDRLLQRFAEAGIPEVVEIGGSPEAWEAAIARFANGDGSGNGEEAGIADRLVEVDMCQRPEISFTTIIEFAANGAQIEPVD
jgi:hypothetical protein